MELVLSQKEPSDTLLGLLKDIQDWFFSFLGSYTPIPPEFTLTSYQDI